MRINHFAILALAGAGFAGAASANDLTLADHNGAIEITRGDWGRAERALLASRRVSPTDPELMLNLAIVYAKNGRIDEARALYRQVQARPDEEMQLAGGRMAGSHTLARVALIDLDGRRIAGR